MEDFYVCPHHQTTGGYEDCCNCAGWCEDEPKRLCTQNPGNKTGKDEDEDY